VKTENALSVWQRQSVQVLAGRPVSAPDVQNVTALAYFFWDDDRIDSLFYTIESAFLVTRQVCGALPCILVVNRVTPRIEAFCVSQGIVIQIDKTLTGGVPRMNIDCVETLYSRFETEYVMVIQSDGFPLRQGIGEFVGKYDYIGAPWGRASWYTHLIFPYPQYCVGNGGFTVRSKRLCEMSSHYYRRKYRFLPYGYWVADDVFYCRTLPRFERRCRKTMTYAPPEVAGRFAFETNHEFYPKDGDMPFGFHSARGFEHVMKDFGDRINAQFSL
jgi:hypothetical protein